MRLLTIGEAVRYVDELRGPLPGIDLVVSGGVTADDASEYLRAGAHAVCIGGEFVDRTALEQRNPDALIQRGRHVLATATRSDSIW